MNVEVKDITKIEDEKERAKAIYDVLIALAKGISSIPPDATLDKQVVLPFQMSKELKIPPGYERCNGQNGTKDLQKYFTNDFIYIQRVK